MPTVTNITSFSDVVVNNSHTLFSAKENLGLNDPNPTMNEGDKWERLSQQQLISAIAEYEQKPEHHQRTHLIGVLDIEIRRVTVDYNHRKNQEIEWLHEMESELEKKPTSGFLRKFKNWTLNNLKYFFNSDSESKARKYAKLSEQLKDQIEALKRYRNELDAISKIEEDSSKNVQQNAAKVLSDFSLILSSNNASSTAEPPPFEALSSSSSLSPGGTAGVVLGVLGGSMCVFYYTYNVCKKRKYFQELNKEKGDGEVALYHLAQNTTVTKILSRYSEKDFNNLKTELASIYRQILTELDQKGITATQEDVVKNMALYAKKCATNINASSKCAAISSEIESCFYGQITLNQLTEMKDEMIKQVVAELSKIQKKVPNAAAPKGEITLNQHQLAEMKVEIIKQVAAEMQKKHSYEIPMFLSSNSPDTSTNTSKSRLIDPPLKNTATDFKSDLHVPFQGTTVSVSPQNTV